MTADLCSLILEANSYSVDDALRHFLNQSRAEDITETILADTIRTYLERDKHLVIDAGVMYQCDLEGNGLYTPLYDEDLANIVHNIELADIDGGKAKFKSKANAAQRIVKTIKDRISLPGYFAEAPQGIAVQNCFLRIEGQKIIEEQLMHTHRQRHALAVNYNPNADTQMIDNFLFDTLQDQELVHFIYELFGVSICGLGGSLHKFVIFHGSGRNGKGAIVRTLQNILGEGLHSNLEPEDMHKEYNRFDIYGSRVNIIGELPEINRRGLKHVKMLTGGDSIFIRGIGKQGFNYKPIAQHIALTNELPFMKKVDHSISGRMIVVPFNKTIPAEKRIPDIEDKLIAENGEGILLRSIEGARRVLERGRYAEPDAVRRATDAWLFKMEGVRLFAEACLEIVPDTSQRIRAETMFNLCCQFCRERDLHLPTSERDMHNKLINLGFQSKKSGTMQWIGVCFKK